MSGQILVAKESFSCDIDGVPHSFVARHTLVRKGHPVLEGREHLFQPVNVHYEVEQATAAPGEKRSTRRRKAKSAEESSVGKSGNPGKSEPQEAQATAAPDENAGSDAAAPDTGHATEGQQSSDDSETVK